MIKVNLLSPEKKEVSGTGAETAPFPEEEKGNKINKGAIIGAAIITLGVIGGLYFTQAQTIERKQQYLQEREARKKTLDRVLQTLEELERAKSMLDKKVKLISELKSSQQDTVKMMDALVDAMPDWVWLTDLRFSNKQLSISGKAVHNNLISDFINNLKGTGCFYNIGFPGSNREKQSGQDVFNFKLTCSYREREAAASSKKANK